jgi:hypothetical protein
MKKMQKTLAHFDFGLILCQVLDEGNVIHVRAGICYLVLPSCCVRASRQ